MSAPLSPAKKKLHGYLKSCFLLSIAASTLIYAVDTGLQDYQDKQPVGDAVKRTADIRNFDAEFTQLEDLNLKQGQVRLAGRQLKETESSLFWMSRNIKVPTSITVTSDEKWFTEQEEKLEQEIRAVSGQVALRLLHSPNLSNADYTLYANKLLTRGRRSYLRQFEDYGDKEYTPIPGLHECQIQVTAELGAVQNDESVDALKACTDGHANLRPVFRYGAMGGLLCLGLWGRALRKDWDKAIEKEPKAVQVADLPADPLSVTTAKPVTIKPIKIIKKAAV